jgi:hypothetical protein
MREITIVWKIEGRMSVVMSRIDMKDLMCKDKHKYMHTAGSTKYNPLFCCCSLDPGRTGSNR